MSALLEVRDLSKAFGGVQAVDHVTFDLDPGTLLALIGPNGAGKTTCFNMLNGQLRPDGGDILLDGKSVRGLSPTVSGDAASAGRSRSRRPTPR